MEEEPAQELRCEQCHFPLFTCMRVVLPSEGDVLPIKRKESMIGDGDPVCVSTQVAKDLRGAAERWFGVDDPVFAVQPL